VFYSGGKVTINKSFFPDFSQLFVIPSASKRIFSGKRLKNEMAGRSNMIPYKTANFLIAVVNRFRAIV
jgi:hypothetical protein